MPPGAIAGPGGPDAQGHARILPVIELKSPGWTPLGDGRAEVVGIREGVLFLRLAGETGGTTEVAVEPGGAFWHDGSMWVLDRLVVPGLRTRRESRKPGPVTVAVISEQVRAPGRPAYSR